MGWIRGFTVPERQLISSFVDRFENDGHLLDHLEVIEKAELSDYAGLAVPRADETGQRLSVAVYLASCTPFVIAHELAHVSDIGVRRRQTLDHISWKMPDPWQLAHRMSSEYYANRTACSYVEESEVFRVFQSDRISLLLAERNGDWVGFLISYALLLGIFHGLGRTDCDPLKLARQPRDLPATVHAGAAAFQQSAQGFFPTDTVFVDPAPMACAA